MADMHLIADKPCIVADPMAHGDQYLQHSLRSLRR